MEPFFANGMVGGGWGLSISTIFVLIPEYRNPILHFVQLEPRHGTGGGTSKEEGGVWLRQKTPFLYYYEVRKSHGFEQMFSLCER